MCNYSQKDENQRFLLFFLADLWNWKRAFLVKKRSRHHITEEIIFKKHYLFPVVFVLNNAFIRFSCLFNYFMSSQHAHIGAQNPDTFWVKTTFSPHQRISLLATPPFGLQFSKMKGGSQRKGFHFFFPVFRFYHRYKLFLGNIFL